jgi:hypothetical protein
MKKAILATLLFSMLVATGCATVGPAVGEQEEEIRPASVGGDEAEYRRRIELWDFMGDAD